MRVTVTGALGMVGTVTCTWLAEHGHSLRRIDLRAPRPEETRLGPVDCVDLTSFEDACRALEGADAVVHLAGMNNPITAPEWEVHNTNVVISYNVLTASAELGVRRVVQASSVNAIGMSWSRRAEFDYLPVDLEHRTRNEDGYSLSKLVQELQADSLTRRYAEFSVASLRLHAVLERAADAQGIIDQIGVGWAVNGLFGYCTHESVASAFELGLTAAFTGQERLWVVEPETFSPEQSAELARRHYPNVPLRHPLIGREAFIDASRTREVLAWVPSTHRQP